MKFISIDVENFKLLRDVSIDFSTNSERPLTVIRAENGSGKTSLLTAMRWALYGNDSLNNKRLGLGPIDWPSGVPCPIQVNLEFQHTTFSLIGGEWLPHTETYRLIRIVTEQVDKERRVERNADSVSLYKYSDEGAEPVANPELLLDEMLPLEQMDVFFTDGDAALNFISADISRTDRRDQVQQAIRSLLGLELLESGIKHTQQVQTQFAKQAGAADSSGALTSVSQQTEEAQTRLEQIRTERREVVDQLAELDAEYEEADKSLQAALQAGNHDELAERRERAAQRLTQAATALTSFKKEHQDLLESEQLSWALMGEAMQRGFNVLRDLNDKGVIPKTTVSVLKDRLELQKCICGESLAPGSERRRHVEDLIHSQHAVDEERAALTRLFHEARKDFEDRDAQAADWVATYRMMAKNRLEMSKLEEETRAEEKYCEEELKKINELDIEDKRQLRDAINASRVEKAEQKKTLDIEEAQLDARYKELSEEVGKLAAANKQLVTWNARLNAAGDLLQVLRGSLRDMQEDRLHQVSERMNELFLDILQGEVSEEYSTSGAIVGATIDEDYDIVVNSTGGNVLHPEYQLNGAAKRALTFAFIWALTEVSQTVAPRVVDTPLGMMAGGLKRRALQMVSEPSGKGEPDKQVILLLTRSEIAQCEDIIDERAGHVLTLSNSAHYPSDLVNDPLSDVATVIRCDSNHRTSCSICQRKDDARYGISISEIARAEAG